MVHCFITGVESAIEGAYVFNRRGARDRLEQLKAEVASLSRLYSQLSPLDEKEFFGDLPEQTRQRLAPKQHRLVCKAVAEALAPGFPEIKLFLTWAEYRAQVRKTLRQAAPAQPTVSKGQAQGNGKDSLRIDKTGQSVLQLLDPGHALPAKVRNAVAFGAVFRLPGRSPQDIVRLILEAATSPDGTNDLGFAPSHLVALRALVPGDDAQPSPVIGAEGEVGTS
jgi:hypothetical protein